MNKLSIGIIGSGISLPGNEVTNSDLEGRVFDFDPLRAGGSLAQWYRSRYGISSRRESSAETVTELASEAAISAITAAGLSPTDIDFLILNTVTGDHRQPTTATGVQRNIGMRAGTFALELNMPCAGPVYGLDIAVGYVRSMRYRYGLVVGVDCMSRVIPEDDFRLIGLFGDGAGAAVVGKVSSGGFLGFHLASEGETGEEARFALVLEEGSKGAQGRSGTFRMTGSKVEELVIKAFSETMSALLRDTGILRERIAFVVPHQAAKGLILKATETAGFSECQVHFTLSQLGNTSSASILITLHDLLRQGIVSQGDIVLIVGMGGGLNRGGALLQV